MYNISTKKKEEQSGSNIEFRTTQQISVEHTQKSVFNVPVFIDKYFWVLHR